MEVIKSKGINDILLFHCISSYPAKSEDYNLNMIKTLKKNFNTLVGLSDHTLGTEAAVAAVSLGAVAIEKHFKLNKLDKTPDSDFSIDPSQLKELVTQVNSVWKGLGSGKFDRTSEEKKNIIFRRSLYFIKDLKEGHKISKDDINCIRPGYGLAPKYFKEVLSKKTKVRVRKGDRVTFKNIE